MTANGNIAATQRHGLNSLWVWLAAIAIVWLVDFTVAGKIDAYLFSIIMYAGINIILAVSLNLINGFTGQFSMGHAGFMAVGGYISAMVTTTLITAYPEAMALPLIQQAVFVVSLVLAGLGSAAIGYIVGLPSLRLRGDYLAIVTLGFGEIIRVVILNMDAVGGARGLPGIPQLATFGWVYTFVLVTLFTIWRLVHSPHGRVFLAIREDEIAAEAMGVNTTQGKVRAFTLGAAFAGIAGGLFGHFLMFLTPSTFTFTRSFEIIAMVVLGGMGSISGSVIAAVFLTAVPEILRPLQKITGTDFRMVIYSLLLIFLMLSRPNGLMGTREIIHYLPLRLRLFMTGQRGAGAS